MISNRSWRLCRKRKSNPESLKVKERNCCLVFRSPIPSFIPSVPILSGTLRSVRLPGRSKSASQMPLVIYPLFSGERITSRPLKRPAGCGTAWITPQPASPWQKSGCSVSCWLPHGSFSAIFVSACAFVRTGSSRSPESCWSSLKRCAGFAESGPSRFILRIPCRAPAWSASSVPISRCR